MSLTVGRVQTEDGVVLPSHPEEPRGCSRIRTVGLGRHVWVQITGISQRLKTNLTLWRVYSLEM